MAGPNDFGTIVTAILNYQQGAGESGINKVIQQVGSQSPLNDTIAAAMLVGAGLESSWRIAAAGGGAFQITDHVNFDPIDINAAVAYMYPRYSTGATADVAMPEGSAKYADIAYKAERPAKPYAQSQGQAKVDSVYQTVLTNYGSAGATGLAPIQTVVGGNLPGAGFLQPVLSFLGDITDIRIWRSLGWIALGIIVFIIGLIIWLRKPIGNAVSSVAKVGAL